VIDEQFARQYFPDSDPIGARLIWPMGDDRTRVGEIIGVVGSVRWTGFTGKPWSSAYLWFPNLPGREISLVVRTAGDPTTVAAPMAEVVNQIDPDQPVSDIRVMGDLVSAELARPRFTMLLLGVFAAAALLLAALGLYGVLAFAVVQRTREIGIRVSLGAQAGDVLRLVIRRGALLVGAGLAIGLASALALGRFVATLLHGVTPRDLPTLVAVTGCLAIVACAAIYLPARRALRVDPVIALRSE
jgi:predicted lysophospholipase L1 biosynthesis ABC-type transport system permease subunit